MRCWHEWSSTGEHWRHTESKKGVSPLHWTLAKALPRFRMQNDVQNFSRQLPGKYLSVTSVIFSVWHRCECAKDESLGRNISFATSGKDFQTISLWQADKYTVKSLVRKLLGIGAVLEQSKTFYCYLINCLSKNGKHISSIYLPQEDTQWDAEHSRYVKFFVLSSDAGIQVV